jgi:signal transduction histidine kinase
MAQNDTETSPPTNDALPPVRQKGAHDLISQFGTTLDLSQLLDKLASTIAEFLDCERVLVLLADDEEAALKFGTMSGMRLPAEARAALENTLLPIYNKEKDPIIGRWLVGESVVVKIENIDAGSPVNWLAKTLQSKAFLSVPLYRPNRLVGLLVADNPGKETLPNQAGQDTLKGIAESAAIAVENARLHTKTVEELAAKMRELNTLRQIDRELTENIDLNRVFDMTMDWALRYTNGHAASIALYSEDKDELRFVAEWGYELPMEQTALIRKQYATSVGQRVARSGKPEIIPDVSLDPDYNLISSKIQSQMSIPVLREDRVIAVMNIASRRLNAFTDEHLAFVEKLANRAAVAIDNARLFSETSREREKLSLILGSIADAVIVSGDDGRLILVNQSAMAALRLYTDQNYVGKPFIEVFEATPILDVYRRARALNQGIIEEITTADSHVFHLNVSRHPNLGWIIVMHDITPFKQTDQLKTELLQMASHDLKQPLSVMNGYIELLNMQQKLDPQGAGFVKMIIRAIQNMHQLIDDLMEMAQIETGLQMNMKSVSVENLINECIDSIKPLADGKSMKLTTELTKNIPSVLGDRNRLAQIFSNLIGNAVKYTPPEGKIRIWAEKRDGTLRIAVQDNGLGISPEDQAHIFERFYRVRRPETDSIEGTGLGLAIVKSLVEAHKGEIGLESALGEGSTFYVTLPIYEG